MFFRPGGSDSKESVCNAEDPGLIPGSGRSPGEGNSNHSSVLAWRIPWTEETGGLQSVGSQRSGTSLWDLMRTHARKRPRKVWARQPLQARLAPSHLCSLHSIHKDLSLDGKAVFSLLPQDSSICCPACMSSF